MSQLDKFLKKRNNKLNSKKVIVGAKPAFNKKTLNFLSYDINFRIFFSYALNFEKKI